MIGVARERLVRSSPSLFLAAGALLSLFAAVDVYRIATDASARWSLVLLAGPGLLAGLLGLSGYGAGDGAGEHAVARAGAALAGLGAVAAVGMVVSHAAAVVVDAAGTVGFVATQATLVATALASLAVGVGTLLSDPEQRTVGVLLLVPGVAVGLLLASLVASVSSEWAFAASDALLAAGFLAVGLALRPELPRSLLDTVVPGEAT